MTDQADHVTVYADYVCPFCYLGRRALERYRAGRTAPMTVEWHPYDLRARKRAPDGAIDRSEVDASLAVDHDEVAGLRARYDADDMLSVDAVPEVDSLDAQLVSFAIQETHPDVWSVFHGATFDALWVDGRDIGDAGVLVDIATTVGVSEETVRSALRDTALRERLHGRFERARARGVTGVPTFVHGDHVARGVVPPAHLRRLVEGE